MNGSVFARQPAWVLALGVALAYFATARLGLELAMPGGHVTPVWPPSGIALAAVLLCGRRVWPGIWLGSFAANLWDFYGSRGSLATEIIASLAIACGAAVLLIGAFLCRCEFIRTVKLVVSVGALERMCE